MKSFDDFLATMGDDGIEQIISKNAYALSGDEDSVKIKDIVPLSLMMSTSLLRRYHQWLSDQLAEQAAKSPDD